MKSRFEIVIAKSPSATEVPFSSRLGRAKLVLAAILFASLAVAVLIVILLLGSLIAAILWIALVLSAMGLILKTTIRRISR